MLCVLMKIPHLSHFDWRNLTCSSQRFYTLLTKGFTYFLFLYLSKKGSYLFNKHEVTFEFYKYVDHIIYIFLVMQ